MLKRFIPMFFSKSSLVLWLTFRSLIHFKFTFVYGVRQWSSFILLHVAGQFCQHHLLKRLSFPHCMSMAPLLYINWPCMFGLLSSLFCSTGLWLCSCASTKLSWFLWLCSRAWSWGARSPPPWFFSGLLWLLGSLVFPHEILNYLFQFVEECCL